MKIPLVALCLLLATANLPAEDLKDILARMDEASQTFKGVSADMQRMVYTKVIDDHYTESGTLKMQRQKDGSTRALIEVTGQNDAKTIFFAGSTFRIFYPKLKLYQDYDVGRSSDVVNQYLLLGFGSSGNELTKNYEVSSAGVETIAGQETTKLELIPKSSKVKERFTKIDIWIAKGFSYPLQEKFFQPSGDYFTTQYSNVKLGAPGKGNLEFKLPKGATKQGS